MTMKGAYVGHLPVGSKHRCQVADLSMNAHYAEQIAHQSGASRKTEFLEQNQKLTQISERGLDTKTFSKECRFPKYPFMEMTF